MKDEIWAPGAQLMESMRAVGYSLRTALADIIDNSISAAARNIDIYFSAETERPYLAVLDDGKGMDAQLARCAMQLAGMGAATQRDEGDLGRFGLGLKTASLSQCRRLSIISKQGDAITGLIWDLDHIAATQKWSLIVLGEDEYGQVPHFADLLKSETGTLVVWQNLDRLLEVSQNPSAILNGQMADAREHLSLVFHRFLSGDGFPKVTLRINLVAVIGADPFLTKARGIQIDPKESIALIGHEISVQSYTLPFLNNMTAADRRRAQVAGGLRDSQGFYIYRGGRLVIWGTWFRLMPKKEGGKLARVKVDIPNALDHLWSLDIKKSSAVPPAAVRARLKILAETMIEPSQRTQGWRGRKNKTDDPVIHPWELVEDRDTFRYEINRSHPVVEALTGSLTSAGLANLEAIIRTLETTFPVQDLFNRMSSDRVPLQANSDLSDLRGVLLGIWASAQPTSETVDSFVTRMLTVEPLDELRPQKESIVAALYEQMKEPLSHE